MGERCNAHTPSAPVPGANETVSPSIPIRSDSRLLQTFAKTRGRDCLSTDPFISRADGVAHANVEWIEAKLVRNLVDLNFSSESDLRIPEPSEARSA
jgi:hypothetical protein